MSTFRSFQSGFSAGSAQRREREHADARDRAATMFKDGNYEGAEGLLVQSGLMGEAVYYSQAGARRKNEEKVKAYGESFKTGGYDAVAKAAGSRGDFQTAGSMETAAHSQATRQREQKQWGQEDYINGLKDLGDKAQSLKSIPSEQRGQAAMQIMANSPFNTPEVTAAIEKAAADGRITDEEIDAFTMQMVDGQKQLQMQIDQEQTQYNRGMDQRNFDYRRERDAVEDGRFERELAAKQNEANAPDAKGEMQLGGKWDAVHNDYVEVTRQFDNIETLASADVPQNERSAADLALVVAFTKALDPGSVAREGEVALTQSAASLFGQVQNMLPRWKDGETLLPPDTRKALLATARRMRPTYDEAYNQLAGDYRSQAEAYGFEPTRVMKGYRPQSAGPQANAGASAQHPAIEPGAVVDGYAFKGGDPNDQNSWQRIPMSSGGSR